MNAFWGLLCFLQLIIGMVMVIGVVNGFVVVGRWLRDREPAVPASDASYELDVDVATASEALGSLGADVQRAAAHLLGLVGRHPDAAQAIRTAQRALHGRDAGVAVPAPAAGGDPARRSSGIGDQPPWRIRSATPTASRAAGGAALQATAQSILARWFDIDNITMLLYLGAGLIVIAAGIFVGSSWDAIGPTARWGVVVGAALAFFLVGQGFVEYSPKLARAGETFRGVGMVLLPFVAIAYDAFLLDGRAPVQYWAAAAAVLACLYYSLYRWLAPGRVSGYLGAMGVGVVALLVPDTFGLAPEWRAPALLMAAAGLLGVAWATDLSPEPGTRRTRTQRMGALAESHLIVGGLVSVASAIALAAGVDVIRPELPTLVYLTLLGIGLTVGAAWQRSAWPLGAAGIVVGVLVHQVGHFTFDAPLVLAWFLVVVWGALAYLLFFVVARRGPGLVGSPLVFDGIALFYSVSAFAYGLAPVFDRMRARPDGLLVVASAALLTLLVGYARRRREPLLLLPAAMVAHVLVLDALRLAPGQVDLYIVPTSIWLVMAGAWLFASLQKRPDWAASTWSVLFACEALWAALYAMIDETYVSAVVGGVVLTAAWSVWMLTMRGPLGAVAVVVQSAYALFALWLLTELPAPALPLAWVALCVTALAAGGRLPDSVRLTWDQSACAALVAAPLAGYAVAEIGAPATAIGVVDLALSGQIALLLSLLILGSLGWDRSHRSPVAVSMVQAYLLYAWVLADVQVTVAQAYSAPLALTLLGLAWLLAEAREPLEGAAAAFLLVPAAAQAVAHDTLGYTLLLGVWGLALLAVGVSFNRRVLLVGGIVGLLLAALRQLWEIIELLPPGFVVGAVGLVLMTVAVLLTWQRDAMLELGRRGGRYWDEMGGGVSR